MLFCSWIATSMFLFGMERVPMAGKNKICNNSLNMSICRSFSLCRCKMQAISCMIEYLFPTSIKPSKMTVRKDTLNLELTPPNPIKLKTMDILFPTMLLSRSSWITWFGVSWTSMSEWFSDYIIIGEGLLTVDYNITMQEDQQDLLFPSFAASPNHSPGKYIQSSHHPQER